MSKDTKKVKKSKLRKTLEWIFLSIFGVFFVVIFGFQIVGNITKKDNFGVPNVLGTQIMMVLTDSMEPDYKVDDMIIVQKISPEKIYNLVASNPTTKEGTIKFQDTAQNLKWIEQECLVIDTDSLKIDLSFYYSTSQLKMTMTHRLVGIRLNEDIKEGSGRYDFFVQGINKESKNYSGDQGQAFDERVLLGKVQFGSTFLGIVYKGVTSVWGLLILILLPSGYLIITSILDIVKGLKEDDEDTKQKVESTDGLQLSNEDKERLKSELLEELLNKTNDKENKKWELEGLRLL